MKEHLEQFERDDLSAYLDGELPSERAAQVERLVATNPAWARALAQLRALAGAMEASTVSEPPADLADVVIRGVRARETAWEDVSACLDGELPAERADEVRRLIGADPAWAETFAEMSALRAVMAEHEVPEAGEDLAERIIGRVRWEQARRVRTWVVRIAAPLAAAAAVVLAASVYMQFTGKPGPGPVSPAGSAAEPLAEPPVVAQVLKDVPKEDRFVVENLDFFRNYDVVANYETLQAIERVEDESEGSWPEWSG